MADVVSEAGGESVPGSGPEQGYGTAGIKGERAEDVGRGERGPFRRPYP
jgi:hypothetical protein